MVVIEKKTRKTIEEVLNSAVIFFGSGGEGLTISSKEDCCITFTGAVGYVTVSINNEKEDKKSVIVESKEWDYQAKKFLEKI